VTAIPGPIRAWNEARTGPVEIAAGALLLLAVAAATLSGTMLFAAAAAVGVLVLALVRGSLVYLLAYVALIPFEGVGVLAGVGTASRIAAIAFVVVHVARRRGSLRLDPLGAWGWAFVAVAGASYLWSIDRATSLAQLITLGQLVLVTIVIADLLTERPSAARAVALTYATAAVVLGAIGIVEWIVARETLPAGRAVAFEGQDPAQFAGLLIPALFVLVWEVLERPRLRYVVGAVIAAVAIIASGTRSAWVAVGIVMLIGLFPRMSNRQRASLGAVALVLGFVVVIVPALNELTIGRLAAVIESGGTGRTDIWTIGLHVWMSSPLAGVGWAAFPSALTLEVVRATPIPTVNTGFLTPPIGSHSIIVGTLVELGVVGVVCLAGFLWHVLRPRDAGEMAHMARLAVMAILIQALFLDVLGRKQVWLFIAIAIGLAAAARVPGGVRERADTDGLASDASVGEDVEDRALDLEPGPAGGPPPLVRRRPGRRAAAGGA
jgi:O-antigen ligase